MDAVTTGMTIEADDITWLRADVALESVARREAAALARRAGFDERRTADLSLAVTEAATNLLRHASDGALGLRLAHRRETSVDVLTLDNGPGIADIASALSDGHSTSGTLGVGLGAIRRLADTFDLHSLPGRGTVLLARFRMRASAHGPATSPPSSALSVDGLSRPISGEQVCGDTWAAHERDVASGEAARVTVMLCDGLGHGPLAARVGERARQVFRQSPTGEPAELVRKLHAGLKGTRGAALAVAQVDAASGRVRLCGVGNVSAFVWDGVTRSALLSSPGIVGSHLPQLRTHEAELPPGAVLVLHSDGLSDRWNPTEFPGLPSRHPAVIAGQVLAQAGVRRDDAGVVVVRSALR
ncbi:ATP-binding SpoIIE family protein phosphatase [Streptomyces sp. NPDC060194]|uniref:ATP-binding SpoIIE family protein phosphatase n=1 Tax=Streptomyces sp. NPDC060194 TaxID=3347069 RepID=UPI0036692020